MALPIEISPNPLVISTVEIRFRSDIESQRLFPLAYSKLSGDLPIFNESKIPKEIRENNPDLAFAPDYILSNDDYSLSFSNKIIAFENVGEYTLWDNYFPFIKKHLMSFLDLGVIEFVERVGVRYASVFNEVESMGDVLKDVPLLAIEGYSQKFNFYRCDLIKDDINLHLQIAENAKAKKNNKTLAGVYVDIDASFSGNVEPGVGVLEIVDKLHSEEKELFFGLLKPEFIESLNPKY